MSLNTYPYNSFPASTDKLDEAHNAELQQEIDQLKSGLTNVNSKLNGVKKAESVYSGSYKTKINSLYAAYSALSDAQKKNSYIAYYNRIYRYVALNTYTSGFIYNGSVLFYTQTIFINSENSTITELVVKTNETTITDLSDDTSNYQMVLFTNG